MAQQTFNIDAGANDAYGAFTSGAWPITGVSASFLDSGNFVTTEHDVDVGGDGLYRVLNGFLKWNTSPLPDDAILGTVVLRVSNALVVNDNSMSLTASWYNWGNTLEDADMAIAPTPDALSGYALSSFVGGYNDITLANNTGVSTTGTTYLRLHLSGMGGGAAPTGHNYVVLRSFENTDNQPAQLIVNYTLPTTRLAPDNIVLRTNLPNVDGVAANDATALAAIDEDPDSADSNWLTV